MLRSNRKKKGDQTTTHSTIVWSHNKYAIIRKVVVDIFQKVIGYGNGRCPLDFFVLPLNGIIDVKLGGDMAPFTEEMVRRAFENNNSSSFADCRLAIGSDFEGILHVRSGKQGSHRNCRVVHDIGLFREIESAMLGRVNADNDIIIPKLLIRSLNLDIISNNIKISLQEFSRNEKKKANYTRTTKQINQKRKRMEQTDAEVEEETVDHLGEMKIDIKVLRSKANEDMRHRDKIMAQLNEANIQLKKSVTDLNEALGLSNCDPLIYDYQHDKKTGKLPTEGRDILHYYLGNTAGVLDLVGKPSERIIVEADLKKGLLLPEDGKKVHFQRKELGGRMYFVPSYHELTTKNRTAEKVRKKSIVDSMEALFSKEISIWSRKAKRLFTAMNSFGYGCSDEGTRFIMGGTLSGLFGEVGLKINEEQISNVVPSGDTLKNWEIELATDCLFGLCWEMKNAKVEQLGITTDHGHRKGQDHLVKLLSFPNLTSDGDYTIDFMCLNIDSAGHTTEEASNAIADDVSALLMILSEFLGDDVKLSVITGDAGGGASVQQLHPALQKKGQMDEWSKKLSCDMHNLNKALEIACIDTWGKQGIGHLTPFQMIWLFVRILKHVRKELVDCSLLDEAWGSTIQYLRDE